MVAHENIKPESENMTEHLTLTALGGLGETGSLNCMLYETPTTAFLVDCGMGFPSGSMPGVNVMIPDFSGLSDTQRSKIQALVLTHGHEDHVGAVTHFFKTFGLPIYATPFTQGIVRQKFKEANLDASRIFNLKVDHELHLGDVRILPIFVNHSILDTVGLLIESAGQRVMHLTDFKIDLGAPSGKVTDLEHFKRIGNEGLDLLLMDSTNAMQSGWTPSEMTVRENLIEQMKSVDGRILVCLFSSNVIRLQSLILAAKATGRKLALTGRSSREYSSIAKDLGQLKTEGVDILDVEDLHNYADSEVMVVVTGSQGEPRSVLQRISEDYFKPFRLRKGDTVFMSSKIIPGNESEVYAMVNRLSEREARVVFDNDEHPIHASGHAKQDELRAVFEALKPRYFVPIHGEHLQLKTHIELAVSCGVPESHTRLTLNGETIAITEEGLRRVGSLSTGRVYLTDDKLVIEEASVRLRRKMALNGMVAVSVVYSPYQKQRLKIELQSYGLIGEEREQQACFELKDILMRDLKNLDAVEPEEWRKRVKVETRKYFRDLFFFKPEVVVLLHEV